MSARTRTAPALEPGAQPLPLRAAAIARQLRTDTLDAALPIDGLLAIAAIAVAFAVALAVGPYDLRLGSDAALFLHYGQRILDGEVPYRDFFDHKTPLVSYYNAAAVGIAGLLRQDPIEVMHVAYMAVGGAIAGLTYGLGRRIFDSRAIGVAAVLILAGYSQFATWVALGSSPKLLMLACGLAAWLAGLHGRRFVAGALVSLAFLAWQPGLLFGAVCVVAASGSIRSRSDAFLDATAFAIGGLLPLAALGLHFLAAGALNEALLQVVVFNREYVDGGARAPAEFVAHMWRLQSQVFGDQWVAWLGALGGVAALIPALWRSARLRSPGTRDAAGRRSVAGAWSLAAFVVLVLGASMVNTGGESDLVLFVPVVTLLPAFAIVGLARAAIRDWRTVGWAQPAASSAALLLIGVYAFAGGVDGPGGSLRDQRQATARIAEVARLQDGEPVLALGAYAFAALQPYRNIARYPYTYSHVPAFVAEHDPGGLALYRAAAVQYRPKLVLYERQPILAGFTDWLTRNYARCTAPAIRRILEVQPHPVEMWVRADVAQDNRDCVPPPRKGPSPR